MAMNRYDGIVDGHGERWEVSRAADGSTEYVTAAEALERDVVSAIGRDWVAVESAKVDALALSMKRGR